MSLQKWLKRRWIPSLECHNDPYRSLRNNYVGSYSICVFMLSKQVYYSITDTFVKYIKLGSEVGYISIVTLYILAAMTTSGLLENMSRKWVDFKLSCKQRSRKRLIFATVHHLFSLCTLVFLVSNLHSSILILPLVLVYRTLIYETHSKMPVMTLYNRAVNLFHLQLDPYFCNSLLV